MNNKPFHNFLQQLLEEDELKASIQEARLFLEQLKNSGKPGADSRAEALIHDCVNLSGRVTNNDRAISEDTEERHALLSERNKIRKALTACFSSFGDLPELNYTDYGKNLPKLGKYRLTKKRTRKLVVNVLSLIVIIVFGIFMIVQLNKGKERQAQVQKNIDDHKAKMDSIQKAREAGNKTSDPIPVTDCEIETGDFSVPYYRKPEVLNPTELGKIRPHTRLKVTHVVNAKWMGTDNYFFKITDPDSGTEGWVDNSRLEKRSPSCFPQ